MPLQLPGANPNLTHTTPQFEVGTITFDTDNYGWRYTGPTVNAIGANAVCNVDSSDRAVTGTGYTTKSALAVGEYGWVRKTPQLL